MGVLRTRADLSRGDSPSGDRRARHGRRRMTRAVASSRGLVQCAPYEAHSLAQPYVRIGLPTKKERTNGRGPEFALTPA